MKKKKIILKKINYQKKENKEFKDLLIDSENKKY